MRPFSYLLIPAPSLLISILGQLVGASLWRLSGILELLPQMVGGASQTQRRSLIGTCEVQCPVRWLNFPGPGQLIRCEGRVWQVHAMLRARRGDP